MSYFLTGDRILILGVPFRVHRVLFDRDVITVYSWRDVVARPITVTAAVALGVTEESNDS